MFSSLDTLFKQMGHPFVSMDDDDPTDSDGSMGDPIGDSIDSNDSPDSDGVFGAPTTSHSIGLFFCALSCS